MTPLLYLALGLLLGWAGTAWYYRRRISAVIAELAASRRDLQRAVNTARPKE
jgi:hypothetical protein